MPPEFFYQKQTHKKSIDYITMTEANKSVREEQSSFSGSNDSRESHHTGLSVSSGISNTDNRLSNDEYYGIARAEDRAVIRIRLMVATFLTLCTVGVACLVFFNTKTREEHEFKESVSELSAKIFEAIGSGIANSLGAIDAYVVSLVTVTQVSNMTWPFITIPNSATGLAKLRSTTKATIVTIAPRLQTEWREQWNIFSLTQSGTWLQNNFKIQKEDPGFKGVHLDEYATSALYDLNGLVSSNHSDHYPDWQAYPSASTSSPLFNFDLSSIVDTEGMVEDKKARISGVRNAPMEGELYNSWLKDYISPDLDATEPVSEVHYPILNNAAERVVLSGDEEKMIGVMLVMFYWRDFMTNILPIGTDGLDVVVENTCNQSFTYRINGPSVVFLGFGDKHDSEYNNLRRTSTLGGLKRYSAGGLLYTGVPVSYAKCSYIVSIYPSTEFERAYISSNPWTYSAVAIAIFVFTSCVFATYDMFVERRQKKVMSTAVKSSAIVSSLFPSNVRDRLYGHDEKGPSVNGPLSQKNRLKSFMTDVQAAEGESAGVVSQPIADLFPEATVMFGDIEGFTAWSSTREPSQVFVLLESLYGAFDALASKRGVFKVETIGDCYVAVAGLPDPRPNHAVVMAKFAHDCISKMSLLMTKLGSTLGPDTEDLCMRFGLNTGPVTAGVLRGQKSRFQLFGDTVNTAARMESSGKKKCIHASESTAEELIKRGKGHWVHVREDLVQVKGKGHMATCWVQPRENDTSSVAGKSEIGQITQELDPVLPSDSFSKAPGEISSLPKIERLVDWNADVLARLLLAIMKQRSRRGAQCEGKENLISPDSHYPTGQPIDEVKEIITMPRFDACPSNVDTGSLSLKPEIKDQIHDYVAAIAATYHDSAPFHNFEHASHVCMSVTKLMSRIVATDTFYEQNTKGMSVEAFKHEQTFGIASDPLTLFACAFAALIHDADHPGVPNAQLVKEGTYIAQKYNNRSVAEQWSVDVAWNLLMEERFKDFRLLVCPTPLELQRFRELVVNGVMATDIMDRDLKQLRNDRWDRAFDISASASDDYSTTVNRKATIVIEHLIQASDVAHTMQHWHVFRKWNERLFREMVQAYKAGRADKDPAEFWYQGEIGFFDFYIIPLAKKLSSCGVFGVSSDEYLNYALKNREEWLRKGKQVVAEMVESLGDSS